jgi:hypothetical protein
MSHSAPIDESPGEHSEIGITRGNEPIEDPLSPEALHQAELAHEAAITAGREEIGVTRGGQPIERLTDTD